MLEREEISNHELSNRVKRIVSDFNKVLDVFDSQNTNISRQQENVSFLEDKVDRLNRQVILMSLFMCAQFVILLYVGFCTFYD